MLAVEQSAPEKQRSKRAATLAMPIAPVLQRKCACGGTATSTDGECQQCKKKKLQRRAEDFRELNTAPPIVEEVLDSPGLPLDAASRSFMEPRFGHDFGKVRVHTDHKAAESARAVNALAYTVGSNVVFAHGQYAPNKAAGRKLLAHELAHVVQQRNARNAAPQAKLEVGPVNDSQEQEADRIAEQVAGVSDAASIPPPKPPGDSKPRVQRAIDEPAPSSTSAEPPAAAPIVDDEAQQLGPGQMRKTEFLNKLRTHVCSVADAVLASLGRTAQGCPVIERWIGHLREKNVQYIVRGLRKYASPAAQASAQDYINAVGEKVREGVTRWAATGEVSGVPSELMSEMMGGGVLGALAGMFSGIGSAISGAVSGIGKLFAKAQSGGAREGNPAAIQAKLNSGMGAHPLETGVKTRMESAFGHSFSRVRVHADSHGAQLSSHLNARAFTIGNHIAFAAGEYKPGTLIGDALIAHELAHVVQQGGGAATPIIQSGSEYGRLEEDADTSAVSAMVALWGGAKSGLKAIAQNALPRLRSGLRLQRCGGAAPAVQPITPVATNIKWDTKANCAGLEDQISKLLGKAIPTVRAALDALNNPKTVADPLLKNFKMPPDNAKVDVVKQVLQGAIESMEATAQGKSTTASQGTAPSLWCVPCQDYGGTTYACNTSPPVPLIIQLCVQNGKLVSPDPLKTVIHEFIHASCGRTQAVVGDPKYLSQGTGVSIVSGGATEAKYQTPQATIDENLKSAYAYAQFVIDVTGQH